MRRVSPTLVLAAMMAAPPLGATAGDLTVTVRDLKGAPVANAVVTVTEPGASTPPRFTQPLSMSQRDMQFSPFVLAVPLGADVNFKNEDKVRHQIYSFSPAKRFDLKLFGRDQSHSIKFDRIGTVALGCNIHDNMVAFIRVTDAPFAQVTDSSGQVFFRNIPAGHAQVHAWQPYLRAAGNEVVADATIPTTGTVEHVFAAAVSAPRR